MILRALSIDLKTTDLPRGKPITDPAYPRMIQIGGVKFTGDGNVFGLIGDRVRQEGVRTSRGAEAVHGLSDRATGSTGLPERVALAWITNSLRVCTHVVGWGLGFDLDVVRSALIRHEVDPASLIRPGLIQVDLMQICTPIVNKQDEEGRQVWPSLSEGYEHIMSRPLEGPHDGLRDAQACRDIFLVLMERRLLPDVEREAA